MSDYSLLKVAAEAAEAERLENGHRWPEVDECDWFDTSSGPEYEYLCSVSPATVLGLIAEIQRLDSESQNLSNYLGSCDRERRALIAENQSLFGQLEDADEQVVALEKQVKALIRASISSPENH